MANFFNPNQDPTEIKIGDVVAVIFNHTDYMYHADETRMKHDIGELIMTEPRDIEYVVETTQDGDKIFVPRVSNKMYDRMFSERMRANDPTASDLERMSKVFLTMSDLLTYSKSLNEKIELLKKNKEAAIEKYANSL